jgi:hypothetical protein
VFTQLTEGRASGGWPLHAFLDPQTLEPFFCGTYFPPEPAFGRPSFTELVGAVRRAWATDRDGMRGQARRIADVVRRQVDLPAEGSSDDLAWLAGDHALSQVAEAMLRLSDPTNGGFGGAPKFPNPASLRFLLEAGSPGSERVVVQALDAMALGGIFDQVGGGFHRYAVDATWTVPHFEKMLYDQAQLASVYAAAFRRWSRPLHAEVARRTCECVLRDMTGEDGRLLSAQDAEVDAREGANYVWTPAEARAALEDAGDGASVPFAMRLYGLDGAPNFRDPHHPDSPAVHVLRMAARPDVLATEMGIPLHAFLAQRTRVDAALLAARARRRQPITDDKTIAAWSGLMVEGLADAGAALGDAAFIEAACRAARFVLDRMRSPEGGLLRTWRAGVGSVDGFLDDYANMASACLALARVTGDANWCDEAGQLLRAAESRFLDHGSGAWFDAPAAGTDLFVRPHSMDDGAVPSGTSAMLRVQAELATACGDPGIADRAERALRAVARTVREMPVAASGTVLAARRVRAAGWGS